MGGGAPPPKVSEPPPTVVVMKVSRKTLNVIFIHVISTHVIVSGMDEMGVLRSPAIPPFHRFPNGFRWFYTVVNDTRKQ